MLAKCKLFLFTCAFLFLFFLSFVFPNTTSAARNLTISSDKGSLFGNEEMVVAVSALGFVDGETIYIKGAFQQEGSTNYFGYTKKGDVWIKNGETTVNQRQIAIGAWDETLVVRSDFSDTGFKGEGDYKFKVGFYYITSGGNISSVNWSDTISINIKEPDPTPTSTPTLTPTPTSEPTPTSTKTPTVTPKPTVKAVVTKKPEVISGKTTSDEDESEILGLREELEAPTSTPVPESEEKGKIPITAVLFVLGGLGFMGVAGYPFLKSMKKRYNIENEEKETTEGDFKPGDS